MNDTKRMRLEDVRWKSEREAGILAGQFARAASAEKEAILAAFEVEAWLAESSRACLAEHGPRPSARL